MTWTNCLLLLVEALVYFVIMAALFRARTKIGVGLFVCALGVMHFVETYLASVFYVALPFGVISPGSTVLFSGKLMMLLLLYIKEDAATVRQPIYGLLAGNVLMVALAAILRQHEVVAVADGRLPDLKFINEMGVLMVWGTTLLFIDAIAIILLYEKLGRSVAKAAFPRVLIASCCVLSFDQAGFYLALHVLYGAPSTVLIGGWLAKMGAALTFSFFIAVYLRYFERADARAPSRIGEVFDALTYREKYEALVEQAGRDPLTGLLNRTRFNDIGRRELAAAQHAKTPLSLLVIDVDHFKAINDGFGHTAGDQALIAIGAALARAARAGDHVFRMGGEEFAILTGMPHNLAQLLGEHVRMSMRTLEPGLAHAVTASIGVATATPLTASIADLFETADRRLYAAKSAGRDCVRGDAADADLPDARPSARAAKI